MWRRKDALPILLLTFCIVAILFVLSQILVIHQRKSSSRASRECLQLRTVIINMEKFIQNMSRSRVVNSVSYYKELTAVVYSRRIQTLIYQSSQQSNIIGLRSANKGAYYNISKYNDSKVTRETYTRTKKYVFLQTRRNIPPSYIHNDDKRVFTETLARDSGARRFHFETAQPDVRRKILLAPMTSEEERLTFNSQVEHNTQPDSTSGIRANSMEHCQHHRIHFVGPLSISLGECNSVFRSNVSYDVEMGGSWQPNQCVSRERTAIIIPYRDRQLHLACLLKFLIPLLKRQQITFRIFVVEQEGTDTYNKGTLMNAGFKEAWKMDDFDCFIFHDVDMIPENDRNLYVCASMPRHLSVGVDKFNYKLPYLRLVGGVLAMRKEHFLKVNGYSNLYWGWGAEDDDMYNRITAVGYHVIRPPVIVARYKMVKHDKRKSLSVKMKHYLLRTTEKRYNKDGLSSAQYNVTFIRNHPSYTHIMINVGKPPKDMPVV